MPHIFDNIENELLPALQQTLESADHADFCVGYFNLRGWRGLAQYADRWAGGEKSCCRLLIGMHITPREELRQILRANDAAGDMDNSTVAQEKRRIAKDFRDQLTLGAPTNEDEIALRHLARQLREQKLCVKVYLRHALHAKLYLLHRKDPITPLVGYLGSSNLTLAGLSRQGELNIDVLDSDATRKLADWFEERWHDRWCLDISMELAEIIDESWAGDRLVPPYHVYLKMAYHLAQEARAGLAEFRIPAIFGNALFDFQIAAVQIAARHLHQRRGVLIGDVVGLGKSMMATALAKVFEEDCQTQTLIICPKNLVSMWEDYIHTYHLHAIVLSLSKVIGELPATPRYHVVLIDESHNLRNREGRRWQAIREYIRRNESLCILLSATPYNKNYQDLSAQLGLFLEEEQDLGIRPEKLIAGLGGEPEFIRRHQCPVRSIAAFEKSEEADDWRDLMRLYMVRRTRNFIMRHYAKEDAKGKYLEFADGTQAYFPQRIPKKLTFQINDTDPNDPYARFYSDAVVTAINSLELPRYGLGNYLKPIQPSLTFDQEAAITGLSRAGSRLMGFCRTNLFKRLESAGPAFLISLDRHILRNFVVLHAINNGLDIPLGTQGAELLDIRYGDEDRETLEAETDDPEAALEGAHPEDEDDYRTRAASIYAAYSGPHHKKFTWLPGHLFTATLAEHLRADAQTLIGVQNRCGPWQPGQDAKLASLHQLIQKEHAKEKLLIFTQFADTARYLKEQLAALGVRHMEMASGDSDNPTDLAWRFSPRANNKGDEISAANELRVLIATDVLSEGQNLQDCAIIVNYDLPWAIIRLIQRAGRVDRIGQQSDTILCYSFLPADGIERLIRLRSRVQQRLEANAQILGSDEIFFGGEERQVIIDLYNEKSGILDDEDDTEVDLSSYAYQIWKDAIDADPALKEKVEALPSVVYATKAHQPGPAAPRGVLIYTRTNRENDILAWIDESGNSVTQSQLAVLKAAACAADTLPLPRTEHHHTLTQKGLKHIGDEEKSFGSTLGRPSGARFKTYERIKHYRTHLGDRRDLVTTDQYVSKVDRIMEAIYRYPLHQAATDTLNRQIRSGIEDHKLMDILINLHEEGRLCVTSEVVEDRDPSLICSLGLA